MAKSDCRNLSGNCRGLGTSLGECCNKKHDRFDTGRKRIQANFLAPGAEFFDVLGVGLLRIRGVPCGDQLPG
jgi:hypothetical protein